MKKKIMIIGVVLLGLLIIGGIVLGIRTGRNLANMREEAEKEKLVTPIPTAVDPTPSPVKEPEPTEEPRGYQFYGFSEQLEEYLSNEQIQKLKEQTSKYLGNSLIHRDVSSVICTEYVEENAGLKEITGYLQLDDNSLLKFVYDFNRDTISLMDTASTMKELQAEQRQVEEGALSEEERQYQEEMTRRILEQEEEAEREAARQLTPTPTPYSSSWRQSYPSRWYEDSETIYSSYTQQENQDDGGEALEEQIDPYSVWEDSEKKDIQEDLDAIEEEQIPAFPIFTDGD